MNITLVRRVSSNMKLKRELIKSCGHSEKKTVKRPDVETFSYISHREGFDKRVGGACPSQFHSCS